MKKTAVGSGEKNLLPVDGAIARSLFRKALMTMLVAELANGATAIIDGILTGRFLGGTALAVSGLGSPYYSVASIVSGLLMVGCTNLCTKAIGKGDKQRLSDVFSLTLVLGVLLSGVLALTGFFMPEIYARLFGAGGEMGLRSGASGKEYWYSYDHARRAGRIIYQHHEYKQSDHYRLNSRYAGKEILP